MFKNSYITSYCFNDENCKKQLVSGRNVLFRSGDEFAILPHRIRLKLTDHNKQKLLALREFDVVEFYDHNLFDIFYQNSSNDNTLVITNQCNSNCIMCPCSSWFRKRQACETTEHLCNLVKYIPQGAPHLTITGGEPTLLKEGLFDVFDSIRENLPDTECLILTNGRTLSNVPYFESLINHLPPKTLFGIPLYGPNASIHDSITQSNGSFFQTVQGLHNLQQKGIPFELRFVETSINSMSFLETCVFIAQNFPKTTVVNIIALELTGSAYENRNKVWIPYEKAFQNSRNGIKYLIKSGINVSFYNFPLCKVDRSYWQLCSKSITDYKIRYAEDCKDCELKTICGGVFSSTLLATKMKLIPPKRI